MSILFRLLLYLSFEIGKTPDLFNCYSVHIIVIIVILAHCHSSDFASVEPVATYRGAAKANPRGEGR